MSQVEANESGFQRDFGSKTARCSFGRWTGADTSRRLEEVEDGELWVRDGTDSGEEEREVKGDDGRRGT